MYSDPIAYFLTFTTYGSWLHGRQSGSVDWQHNAYESPVLAPNPQLEQQQRAKMKHPEYRLDQSRRAIVLETILEVAEFRGWYLWAAHVRTNHVHVVITADAKPEKVLSDLKAWSSRRLKERLRELHDLQRWTHHGSTRYIWNEDARNEKIIYVLDEQGERMAWYSAKTNSHPEASAPTIQSRKRQRPKTNNQGRGGDLLSNATRNQPFWEDWLVRLRWVDRKIGWG